MSMPVHVEKLTATTMILNFMAFAFQHRGKSSFPLPCANWRLWHQLLNQTIEEFRESHPELDVSLDDVDINDITFALATRGIRYIDHYTWRGQPGSVNLVIPVEVLNRMYALSIQIPHFND